MKIADSSITLDLPLPVSVNAMYKHTRTGVILSVEARAYKETASVIARNAANLSGWIAPEYLEAIVWLWMPSARPDADNYLKLLIDSVAPELGFNDRRIVNLHVYRRTDRANPRCSLELKAAQI